MLAGSWGFFLGSQFLTLDMGLTFFLTAAMLSFVLSRRTEIPPGAQRNWMLLAWAAAACAVLSKGLVGVVIPGLALAVYLALERDLSVLRRLHWIPGLGLFAAIVLPWFILVQHRNPEFFQFFFVHEHLARYALPDHHRPGPWWYFVPVVLVGLWPWTPAVPAAIVKAWRAHGAGFNLDRFLVIWAAVVIVFFSASQSKLPGYILPALPAILLLFARHHRDMSGRLRRAPALASVASGLALMVLAAVLPALSRHLSWSAFDPMYSIWLFSAALALSAAGLAALGLQKRSRYEPALAVVALGSLLAAQLVLSGTHVVDEHYSSERLIEPIAGDSLRFPRDPPFYSVASYDQSVPFYLGRSVTLVGYKDELAPGIAAEPDKYVASVDEFLARWRTDADAFAIMTPRLYEKLSGELPGRVLARDSRWIVVARR
jgi:4-amino-4-deoxy-L-arabinose transferase-like glycosyltransferase